MICVLDDEIVDCVLWVLCLEMGSWVGMVVKFIMMEYVCKYGVLCICFFVWRIGWVIVWC